MRKLVSILLALSLVVSVGLASGMPVQAAVSQPQVTVNPVLAGAVAGYTIVFDVTASLEAGVDSVAVDFPLQTTVPVAGNYTLGDVKINNTSVSVGDIAVEDQKVTIRVPINIVAPATVTVLFTADADIVNPAATGDYTLWVNTSRPADATPVESAAYAIRELPKVTGVSPGKGSFGGTMWVVITGNSFMGDADTNASATTIGFGVGADVLQTKYISVTEINVQIYVKGSGVTVDVTAQTPAGSSEEKGSFTATATNTKQVDVWEKYTPSDIPFTANTLRFKATHDTIGAAISAAGTGHTSLAHSGLYVEDLVINKQGLILTSVSGKAVTTIKGVQRVPVTSWPLAAPNIDIQSSGVKIYGFTIAGPDYAAGYYTSGMVIGGSNVEVWGNAFKVTGAATTSEVSQAIQTKSGSNVSGLSIHDNTFAALASGSAAGYEGIYINYNAATTDVSIANNVFGGEVLRAITTECSNTSISGNTIITSLAPGFPGGYQGIWVGAHGLQAQDSVSVIDNIVTGSATGKGFARGIDIGKAGQTLTNIGITRNTVQNSGTGILVQSSADGVMINYNTIDGNTEWGVENIDTDRLNALHNWWGKAIGPHHDTRNPGGQLNAIAGNADFSPWLYKSHEQFAPDAPCLAGSVVLEKEATLVTDNGATSHYGGWNSFSTPITLDSTANTVSKLLALAAEGDLFILRAQRFDAVTQSWVLLIANNSAMVPDYQIKPGEGFFIQVRDAGSLPILVSNATSWPPQRDLVAGWNLIGTASLEEISVAAALSGVSYSVVLSPRPPNETAWSVPPDLPASKYLQIGEAYWVAVAAPGKLFGYTTTPAPVDMIWDLNR